MTWIVGYNSIFGYTFLISDIQVTVGLTNPRYFDCCKKIFSLTNFIGAGFAGSVKIGFTMMDALRDVFASNLPSNAGWCLDEITNDWLPDYMSRVYDAASSQDKKSGCEIIMASAHPNINIGPNAVPLTQIATFAAPDFRPILKNGLHVMSIGSGSQYYENDILAMSKDMDLIKCVIGSTNSYSLGVHRYITNIFNNSPKKGISSTYQVMSINRNEIYCQDIRYRKYNPDGTSEFSPIPDVFSSYESLVQYIQKNAPTANIQSIVC